MASGMRIPLTTQTTMRRHHVRGRNERNTFNGATDPRKRRGQAQEWILSLIQTSSSRSNLILNHPMVMTMGKVMVMAMMMAMRKMLGHAKHSQHPTTGDVSNRRKTTDLLDVYLTLSLNNPFLNMNLISFELFEVQEPINSRILVASLDPKFYYSIQ
mmetsp:Transcript_25849/g.61244  ORF Transcript_25849/g.61244 Transcript_25849/m.61244 type:complete len:157 (+) Transcript_25849:1776-2246(+)